MSKYLNEYKRNLNAFAYVAQKLHPQSKIVRATQITEVHECGTDVNCVITFEDGYVVTKTYDANQGDTIVVLNPKGVITNSIWYFAFNWTGLMATSKDIEF